MDVMYIEHKEVFFFFSLDYQALQQYCIKVVLVIVRATVFCLA